MYQTLVSGIVLLQKPKSIVIAIVISNACISVQTMFLRRQWHPTPVPLPGKSHGWRSLWGRSESDTTERLHFHFFTLMHWRRKWQHTPVFLPGESQGRGSLVGCRLWGRTESDTTEVTQQQQSMFSWDVYEARVLTSREKQICSE